MRRDDYRDDYRRPRERSFFSRHPALSVFGVIGGALLLGCLGCCGFGMFTGARESAAEKERQAEAHRLGVKLREEVEAQQAEGDRLWVAGKKKEATSAYRALLDRDLKNFPNDKQKATIYGRMAEYELDRGDDVAAKAVVEKALDAGLDVTPEGAAARKFAGDMKKVRAEKVEREAKVAKAKREEEGRKAEEAWRRRADEELARKAEEEVRKKAAKKWYQGGTLHNGSMRDWRLANYDNKLATASDMFCSIVKTEGGIIRPSDVEDGTVRRGAGALVAALDGANKNGENDEATVAQTVAIAWVLGKERLKQK